MFPAVSEAAFDARIFCVVGGRPEEQVVGAHARWVIAGVENEHAFGNRAVMKFPGKAVGSELAAEAVVQHAVASDVTAGPGPASVGFRDSSPEPFDQGAVLGEGHVPVFAEHAATLAAAFSNPCGVGFERGAAVQAGAINHGVIILHPRMAWERLL